MYTHKRILFFALLLSMALTRLQAQDGNIWSLQKCLEHARSNNIALKQAQLTTLTGETNLAESQARRLPNASASTSAFSRFGYFVDPFTNTLRQQNSLTYDLNVSGGVDLYTGGRITNGIEQSQLNLAASRAAEQQQDYTLSLNVALAYMNILQAGELLESSRLQLASTTEQKDRTEKLVKAGSLAQADLYQLQSQMATEELNIVSAENQLELANLALQQLLNLDLGTPFGIEKMELPDPEGTFLKLALDEIYTFAEQNQPSVQRADLNVRSSEIDIAIAKGALYPTLSLFANLGTGYSNGRQQVIGFEPGEPLVTNVEINDVPATITTPQFQPIYEPYSFPNQLSDNISASVSLSLRIPIYSRRQTLSSIERAKIATENAQYAADLARQDLKQTIQQAYVDARSAWFTYQASKKQLEATDLTAQNVEKQFAVGLSNSLDYLVAKNNLNRSRFDLVRAKYTYLFRMKVLDFYMGKSLGFGE
ncbi:MAG: TolC family protein [Bacteroidetes bacterium]|nr:MAG: TolC family protein [Bacteroidota bacterium]